MLGQLLALVLAYELGGWETVEALSVDTAAPRKACLEAVEWPDPLSRLLLSG